MDDTKGRLYKEQLFKDFLTEHLLYGQVLIVTNPADGGPARILKHSEYDIVVTPKGVVSRPKESTNPKPEGDPVA